MTTAWEGFNVSLHMIVCHGLLQLAVLLVIAVDEEEVSKECLLGIVLDLGLLCCIS